jgi:hypothetical protein
MSGDIVVGGHDVIGDGMEGDGIVIGRHTGGHHVKVKAPPWAKNASNQGVSTPQEELDALPLGAASVSGGEGGLTNAAFQLTSNPQRPFRGERYLFTAIDSDGNDVEHLINIQLPMFVGMVSIGAAFGQMPLKAFQATAFGVRLSVPASGQGTIITIPLIALVVPASKTVTVTGVLFGRAVR